MRHTRTAMTLAFGGLLLAGCAGVAEVTGTASQSDIVQLRADLTAVQHQLQRTRAELEKRTAQADVRVEGDTRRADRQIEELSRRVEALSTSVTTLTARMDELNARVEILGRRVATTPAPTPAVPLPPPATATPVTPPPVTAAPAPPAPTTPPTATRPTATPTVASPTATPPADVPPATARPVAPAATTAPAPPPPRPAPGVQPQDVYQAAYIDFSKGSYPLAIAGFREFLRRYPDHPLAGNAQYWIAEAHFSLARDQAAKGQPDRGTPELERAVQEFRKVIANYPRSEKAPTALYKEALALIELKQPALAQSRLQYLIDNFPQAAETPLARERLASLTSGS